jgi:hypothetical protein
VIRSEPLGGAFNLRVNLLDLEESLGLIEISETLVEGGVGGVGAGALPEELGGAGAGVEATGVPETAVEAVPAPTTLTARIFTG